MTQARPYEVVVFGATGFTGALTAQYLARHGGADLRWALAGRNPDKLRLARARLADLNPACASLPLLHADASQPDTLRDVARAARVVISTVGPYIHYGEPLVAACAEAGTDYADLTGEPEFVDRIWLRHHDRARETGARIVTCCGFDSIPHDLGCWFTVQQLPEGVPLKVEGFVRAGGELSGGTLHSAVTAFSRLGEYARVRRQRREQEGEPVDRRIGTLRPHIRFEKRLGTWVLPFPTIDPQIVCRSAAADDRYGPDFRYGHYLQVKTLPRAALLMGGAAALFAGSQLRFTRERLLALRPPGQGPGEEARRQGWFRVRFIGRGGGQTVMTEVTGGDPGYGETSKMLAESALCLARDRLPGKAGVLTPAQAMAAPLLKRLQAAGIVFKVLSPA